MTIHKLPDYVINRLKAWEIVERPSSILKELVENSLDAWAQHIEITVNDWWKSFLSVQDDGTWIELSDMDLLLERYATSKIETDEDIKLIGLGLDEYKNIIKDMDSYLGIWIDYTKEITYVYFKYDDKLKEIVYNFIASRATTILEDVLKYLRENNYLKDEW